MNEIYADKDGMWEIYCGDCMNYMHSMKDSSVHLILTDPPFGVGYKHVLTSYNDKPEIILQCMKNWFSEWYRVVMDGAWVFVFTGVMGIEKWITAGQDAGFTFKNILSTRQFCRKPMAFNNFVFEMQPVLVFSKGRHAREFNNVDFFPTSERWLADKRNTKHALYTYAYPNIIPSSLCYGTQVFGMIDRSKHKWHPNAKNETLCRFLVEIASDKGEIVFDPFLGGGTTATATLSCGRRIRGCEQDSKWFSASCKAIEGLSSTSEEVAAYDESGKPLVQMSLGL